MYYDFCHHCGGSIDQNQAPGQTIVCRSCGQIIGVVATPKEKALIDQTAAVIQSGAAARCAQCSQVVQVKVSGGVRSFVPHFVSDGVRKMCPNSGKPIPTNPATGTSAAVAPAAMSPAAAIKAPPPPAPRQLVTSSGKDLSAFMSREVVRVVACPHEGEPTIEQLTLEYLDRTDRIRLQIESLRDILGAKFQMKPYPAALARPHLAVWCTPAQCVVARKHEQGGYQTMSDAELLAVVNHLRLHRTVFF